MEKTVLRDWRKGTTAPGPAALASVDTNEAHKTPFEKHRSKNA